MLSNVLQTELCEFKVVLPGCEIPKFSKFNLFIGEHGYDNIFYELNRFFNICECFLTPTMFSTANHLFKIILEHTGYADKNYDSHSAVITYSLVVVSGFSK